MRLIYQLVFGALEMHQVETLYTMNLGHYFL